MRTSSNKKWNFIFFSILGLGLLLFLTCITHRDSNTKFSDSIATKRLSSNHLQALLSLLQATKFANEVDVSHTALPEGQLVQGESDRNDDSSRGHYDNQLEAEETLGGEWVPNKDPRPLYDNIKCPHISDKWRCPHFNVTDRIKLRWLPSGRSIQPFNAQNFLERMAGKTIAFFGDSLAHQQFQALLCTLTQGGSQSIEDVSKAWHLKRTYLLSPSQITVMYVKTLTLCQMEPLDPHRPKQKQAFHLDRLDDKLKSNLRRLDVVVINTGHHLVLHKLLANQWVPHLAGREIEMPSMNDLRAMVLRHVALQVDQLIRNQTQRRDAWQSQNHMFAESRLPEGSSASIQTGGSQGTGFSPRPRQSRGKRLELAEDKVPVVYMRTESPKHFENGDWDTGGRCDGFRAGNDSHLHLQSKDHTLGMTTDPLVERAVRGTSLRMLIITGLSALRPEMHPAADRNLEPGMPEVQDCSHWCLPGVPDTWNEVLFSDLVRHNLV